MPVHTRKFQIELSEQEFAHVMAALRLMQFKLNEDLDKHSLPRGASMTIFSDIMEGQKLMSDSQLDKFCQKINLLKA